MKIRIDYVSNSSSSSFVIFGSKVEAKDFNVDSFSDLKDDEAFLLVLPRRGSDGDYIFELTPDLLMDMDLHQLELAKGGSAVSIIKVKYYVTEGGSIHSAIAFNDQDNVYWTDEDKLSTISRCDGLEIPSGCKMFRFSKDYGTPKDRLEVLEELECVLK